MYWVGAVGRENRRFDKAEQVKESYFWKRWSESRNSTRKETSFRAISNSTQWICLKSQPEEWKKKQKKNQPPLLPYGLELREREVFWGGNFCLNWCKSSCFSVIATDSHIATFSAATTVRNTQMTNRWFFILPNKYSIPLTIRKKTFFSWFKKTENRRHFLPWSVDDGEVTMVMTMTKAYLMSSGCYRKEVGSSGKNTKPTLIFRPGLFPVLAKPRTLNSYCVYFPYD